MVDRAWWNDNPARRGNLFLQPSSPEVRLLAPANLADMAFVKVCVEKVLEGDADDGCVSVVQMGMCNVEAVDLREHLVAGAHIGAR